MILKEIDMDLPYIIDDEKKNMSPEEIKLDYEKNWKWKRHTFNLTNRCMMSMIARLMPRINTEDCWKIEIECVEKITKKNYVIVGGVCEVQVVFELKKFEEMCSLDKKKYAVEKTKEAVSKLNNFIDISGIIHACDEIKKLNYENIWFSEKLKKKKKNILAQVKVVHEQDYVFLYLVFTNLITNKIETHLILKDQPSEFIFANYFGSLGWTDDNTVKLISKDKKEFCIRYENSCT